MSPAAGQSAGGILWAIAWSVVFGLIGLGLTLLLIAGGAVLLFGGLEPGLRALRVPGTAQVLLDAGARLGGFGLATWIVGLRILGLTPADLRWTTPGAALGDVVRAGALGAGAALAAMLAALLVGAAWLSRDRGGIGDYLVQVTKTGLVLAPAALSEEIVFRGLPLALFARAAGRVPAVLVVGGVGFALVHAGNPGVTPLALANIGLAGVLLGALFFAPGGLWAAFAAHLGWNGALAALDAPVSGLPFAIPLLDYHAGQPALLSGGGFGPEGGLLATGAMAAALVVALRWARGKAA